MFFFICVSEHQTEYTDFNTEIYHIYMMVIRYTYTVGWGIYPALKPYPKSQASSENVFGKYYMSRILYFLNFEKAKCVEKSNQSGSGGVDTVFFYIGYMHWYSVTQSDWFLFLVYFRINICWQQQRRDRQKKKKFYKKYFHHKIPVTHHYMML